ncbi:unnamed protein product (macronuclear) [Paramecium tetraurelia]|uniref:Uncharacterized protein n=1 Tax=Paramecium tetraurelia TaxID=5888 RepID=A0BL01_PARTE|nr:uncharacterized protein GSPATT00029849001 [Paramecium tetraurelia]CAK59218.1 unnamed protein product [Paramecium tetraurelia]|eukprot:XP_001426616.1 hypothetical protein (macronuclear) [Paramecium tetraurelia strain d4-2]
MTVIANQSNEVLILSDGAGKFSIKEFLERQKANIREKKTQSSDNIIRKIAPIKIENQKGTNSSPRFRIKLVSSPLSTNRTTLSRSPQTSTFRNHRIPLESDYVCETEMHIQTNRIDRAFHQTDIDESTMLSPKSPTTQDYGVDSSPVVKTRNVIKSVDDENLLKEQIKPPKRTKKQLRHCLLRALKKLKEMNITTKMMVQKQIFSKKPYQKPFSQEFIHAVKLNQLEKVHQYLEKNKYLVFDFDFFNMSALHWSSKKGLYEMSELLIKYHADVDAIDILNRTPLYLAIQENNIPIIEVRISLLILQLLLRNRAYPWSTQVTDLGEVVKDNKKVRRILTQIRRVDIINMWGEKKLKEEFF